MFEKIKTFLAILQRKANYANRLEAYGLRKNKSSEPRDKYANPLNTIP